MLTRKEKQEIHKDGRDGNRRMEFAIPANPSLNEVTKENFLYQRSLDEFIKYLKTIQQVFSPIVFSRRITATRVNKL